MGPNDQYVFDVTKLAKKYHEGQFRGDDVTPYITHPIEVQQLLKADGYDGLLQCAALLHDVLEDCKGVTTKSMLLDLISIGIPRDYATMIVKIALEMTSPDKQFDVVRNFKRSERKAMMRAYYSVASEAAAIIKAYDRYSNIKDMEGFEPDFKILYANESLDLCIALLIVLDDPTKYKKVSDRISEIIRISREIIKEEQDELL